MAIDKLPFPSNDRAAAIQIVAAQQESVPWDVVKNKETLPNFFRVRFHDGRRLSFAYSDLREIRLLHAGHLVLGLYGMEKYHIVLEGRRLEELATLFEQNRVKSFREDGPRAFERDESKPAIDSVTVETLTGPSY
jgi:hypothetical protein